jgi:hypothetical protein
MEAQTSLRQLRVRTVIPEKPAKYQGPKEMSDLIDVFDPGWFGTIQMAEWPINTIILAGLLQSRQYLLS